MCASTRITREAKNIERIRRRRPRTVHQRQTMQGVEARWEMKWEAGELAYFKHQDLFQESSAEGRVAIDKQFVKWGRVLANVPCPHLLARRTFQQTVQSGFFRKLFGQFVLSLWRVQSLQRPALPNSFASRAWWISFGMISQNLRRQGILNKNKMEPSKNLWIFQFSIKGKGDFSSRNKNQSRFCRCLTSQP